MTLASGEILSHLFYVMFNSRTPHPHSRHCGDIYMRDGYLK